MTLEEIKKRRDGINEMIKAGAPVESVETEKADFYESVLSKIVNYGDDYSAEIAKTAIEKSLKYEIKK